MFDLFRSRAKAVRYLLGALLVLVALSMVITLIPGYGTGSSQADSQIIAEIGKDVLTAREVQAHIQALIRARSFPQDMAGYFVPQYITQMINERAMLYQARKLGLSVTEEEIASTIRQLFPQLFQGGQFLGRDIYANMLAQQNLTIPEFESRIERQIILQRLRSLVTEGVVVTPQEIEQEFHRRNDKAEVDYIEISADKFRSQVSVSADESRKLYAANPGAYMSPMRRSAELFVIDPEKLSAAMEIPESDLRRTYSENLERYRTPDRVKVRHILLKTADKPKDQASRLQAQAEQLLKQIKGGADFAELARKNSEDPGSAPKGGELGWIARGQTVKNFEDTAFSLPPGTTSNVISTEYGYHIIQVQEKEQAQLRSFDQVKGELAAEMKKQRVFDTMQEMADQLRAALEKSPGQAAALGQQFKVTPVKAERITADQPLPEAGQSKELSDAIFNTDKGAVTPLVQLQGDKLAMAVVTDIQPPKPAEFSEVEREIRAQLVKQKTDELVAKKTAEAATLIGSTQGDLKQAAKALGVEIRKSGEFSITGAAEGLGPGTALEQAFRTPVGGHFGPVKLGEKAFFCKVTARVEADKSRLPEQRASILEELKSNKAGQRSELLEDGVVAQLVKEKKVKIHDDVVKRLIANYRSS